MCLGTTSADVDLKAITKLSTSQYHTVVKKRKELFSVLKKCSL